MTKLLPQTHKYRSISPVIKQANKTSYECPENVSGKCSGNTYRESVRNYILDKEFSQNSYCTIIANTFRHLYTGGNPMHSKSSAQLAGSFL